MGLPVVVVAVVVVAVGPDIGMMADSSGGGFVRRSGEAFWVFRDFEEVDIRYLCDMAFSFPPALRSRVVRAARPERGGPSEADMI